MQHSQQQQQQSNKHNIGSGLYGTTTTTQSSSSHHTNSSSKHASSNGHGPLQSSGGVGLDQQHHHQLLLHHDDTNNSDPNSGPHHLPTVAASSTASLVSSSSRTHHKQQTTQQVTTVTKVVREVQHHHLGSASTAGLDHSSGGHHTQHPVVDYVAMPLDMQHLGPDGQPVDYVAMPLGIYPRSQYINYSHMDPAQAQTQQQHQQMYMQTGDGVGGPGSGDPQYGVHHHPGAGGVGSGGGHPHYAEYEHYPSAGQYANAVSVGGQPTYISSGSAAGQGVGGQATYLGDYGLMTAGDHRGGGAGSPSPSDDHSGSQSPQHTAQNLHPSQQPVAYTMQTAYDDMVGGYRITPSPGAIAAIDHPSAVGGVGSGPNAYQDDPSGMVYGYVSTSPYGTTTGGMPQLNPTYGTRPVVYDDHLLLNGSGSGVVGGVGVPHRVMFDNEEELQKHMTALALHGHGGAGHLPGSGNGGGKNSVITTICINTIFVVFF